MNGCERPLLAQSRHLEISFPQYSLYVIRYIGINPIVSRNVEMDDYQKSLAESYSQKSDTALLDLHTQGSLRGVAYVIIEWE